MVAREPNLLANLVLQGEQYPFSPDSFFFPHARDALLFLLRGLGRLGYKKLLLPEYVCDVVTDAVLQCGLDYSFYPLQKNMSITSDLSDFGEFDIFLFINYFGYSINIPHEVRELIKQKSVVVISDNAHSIGKHLDEVRNSKFIDISMASLSKSMPVPFGAVVNIIDNMLLKHFMQWRIENGYLFNEKIMSYLYFGIKKTFFLKKRKMKYMQQAVLDNVNQKMELLYPKKNLGSMDTFLINHIDVRRSMNNNIHNYYCYKGWAESRGLTPVFNALNDDDFPVYFPIMMHSRNERDLLISACLRQRIDAFSWPTMNPINYNQQTSYLWERMVLLPLSSYREIQY